MLASHPKQTRNTLLSFILRIFLRSPGGAPHGSPWCDTAWGRSLARDDTEEETSPSALRRAPGSRIDGCADHCVWYDEIRERVRIPVDEFDSADVVGSNPTGPTNNKVSERILSIAFHYQ